MLKSTPNVDLSAKLSNSLSLTTIIPVIVVILALISLFGSWYTVDQGERGVILRNGKIIGTAEPGLGFKLPMFDSVVRISTQTHTTSYQSLQAYSRDQQPATLRASVTFSIPPDKVEEVYANFKSIDSMIARLLDRQVPTQVENIFGKYTAISVVQERIKFGIDVTEAIKRSIKGPVEITSVQIENIDFSNAYEKSVEDRMRAEVEVQTQLQNLEKERVSAQIAVTQAQAEADSQLARAKAEAESIRIKGIAEATAIKSRAEALAQNQNLVELTKAERWDGKLPTTMLPTGTLPFIDAQK
ncbi:SPFH domain-containing protein [Shewanella sp. SR44-3]|uniref:SPFH domain-containing protein n=1 Tax=unclassified Shewanella TaxID=196818 RepID=UPI0015F7893C|nr:SPFH domain-containing protein [Shewanella sp. SR44-3]MBB1270927.1 prohibitin family protein [Shewanella sp. SR44-3]